MSRNKIIILSVGVLAVIIAGLIFTLTKKNVVDKKLQTNANVLTHLRNVDSLALSDVETKNWLKFEKKSMGLAFKVPPQFRFSNYHVVTANQFELIAVPSSTEAIWKKGWGKQGEGGEPTFYGKAEAILTGDSFANPDKLSAQGWHMRYDYELDPQSGDKYLKKGITEIGLVSITNDISAMLIEDASDDYADDPIYTAFVPIGDRIVEISYPVNAKMPGNTVSAVVSIIKSVVAE